MSEPEFDPGEMPALASAIAALRGEVPVRREWRERVLREVETLPTPSRAQLRLVPDADSARPPGARGSWWRSPLTATAAAAAILVVAAVTARRASPPATPDRMADARGASTAGSTGATGTTGASSASSASGGDASASSGATGATGAAGTAEARTQGLFTIAAPGASYVSLVGDFNQWHPGATPLRPTGDGRTWVVRLALPPGRHVYAFVVDGKLVADPAAPRAADDDFGVPNSVAIIGAAN